ncbi:hypothetical protein OJ996_17650 [Luteolibacter sp. GHJ8]|uniref:Uncharacterized protein n=1 Tax=Luteolibacter rhizosphaerae TaxID=2989719 RepID=A0ABT3G769_9BACT|nr:hypothetical protein [Luteolibacter rhizosphaerae]MCW1915414.1 hypothetical protein [Luteolibacter rhizosphaerae]
MPPAPPDINPSRQVERIREILVGRQMDSVERRLERLEANLRPMPTQAPDDVFEIRLANYEQRHDLKLQELRDEIDAEKARRVEETHRLAGQIQAAARGREASGLEAQAELEQRVTRWLESWNQGFRQYLQQRETHLISEMRSELEQTKAWVNSRLESTDDARVSRMQASFAQLAEAARAIADAAAQHATPSGGIR